MSEHTVRVDNGKYTFIGRQLAIAIHRGGEPWHIQIEAVNALRSLMAELDAARLVLAAARFIRDETKDSADIAKLGWATKLIVDALDKHDRLVDDSEQPSEWCGP